MACPPNSFFYCGCYFLPVLGAEHYWNEYKYIAVVAISLWKHYSHSLSLQKRSATSMYFLTQTRDDSLVGPYSLLKRISNTALLSAMTLVTSNVESLASSHINTLASSKSPFTISCVLFLLISWCAAVYFAEQFVSRKQCIHWGKKTHGLPYQV